MDPSVRFCIQCGRELRGSGACDNPDCRGVPDFYRDVPPPSRIPRQDAPRPSAPSARAPQAGPASARPPADGLVKPAAPVAVLMRLDATRAAYPIRPGTALVGAAPPADIIVDAPEVSARHAVLECRQAGEGGWEFRIADQGSTNGTWVNGRRIDQARVKPGDRIRLGKVECLLKLAAGRGDTPRVTLQIK